MKLFCNNKQRWSKGKCRCECKQLIDKRVCDKGYFFNPSNCECECDKFCNIIQYLDYSDCKCKNKLIDPLIEECTENDDDETKIVNTTVKNDDKTKIVYVTTENEHSSCKVYIVLMTVVLQFLLELLFILFITIGLLLKIRFSALNLILTKKY